MKTPVSAATAEHYIWGEVCDGWHLARDERLSIIEERMPPETSELRHFHRRARQFFYVLEGELSIEIDGKMLELKVGQGIEITPGECHQTMNQSQAPTRFLVISLPPGQGDRTLC